MESLKSAGIAEVDERARQRRVVERIVVAERAAHRLWRASSARRRVGDVLASGWGTENPLRLVCFFGIRTPPEDQLASVCRRREREESEESLTLLH